MKVIDRLGQRYERLTVTGRAPNKSSSDTNARWHCRCDCGRMTIAYGQDLQRGKVKSCGCLNASRIVKHGKSHTAAYRVWKAMRARCRDPNFRNYGERGICVAPEWEDFEVFYADMGDPPRRMSIERKDNNGPYCKANCIWATSKEQLNNQRRNRLITAFGRTQTIAQWAEETGVDWFTLRNRIDRRKWSPEEAISKPKAQGTP